MNKTIKIMHKILFLLISLSVLLSACGNNTETTDIKDFTVSGVISNVPQNTYISLIHRTSKNTETLDSVMIIDSTFELSANISDKTEFFLLKLSNNDYYIYLLADSGDNISINADFLKSQQYKIQNSEESELIQILENQLFLTNIKIDSLINSKADISKIEALKNEQKEFSLHFVTLNGESMASIIALSERFITGEPVLPIEEYYEIHTEVDKKLRTKYLQSEYYLQFAEFIKNYEINLNRQNANNAKNETPTTLVNFSAQTINGENFELNSLSGKWILLNFWASWSYSCVANNQLLQIIAQKRPDINIVQISIDKKENILKDTLSHYNFNHILINDTKGWNSEFVNLYNIESLPTNILINPKGEIVLFSGNMEELENKVL